MDKNDIQDKIKEAHKTADRLLTEAELSSKWNKVTHYMGEPVGVVTRWHALAVVGVLVLAFWSPFSSAACSMKTDSWGNSKYTCHDGNSGTLTTDSWGTTRDSRTGTRYKTDAWGTTRGSDGTSWKTDAWGTTRFNDGTTSKTDAWGNTRYSNGTVCKTDSWGTTRCN
jgi:hypothetical protein